MTPIEYPPTVASVIRGRAPVGFRLINKWGDGFAYVALRSELTVIVDAEDKDDGRHWLHVSFSYPDRMPDYYDMKRVKDLFIGPNLKAIMVLPEKREHVNVHPYCLHLFSCLSGDPLPDFTSGMGLI